MEGIRGLMELNPTIGWGLALGTLAILGMPPFGVFASEFMVLTTAMHEHSWATPFLLVALGVAFAAIFGRVQPMVFGEPPHTGCRIRPPWSRCSHIWDWCWCSVCTFRLFSWAGTARPRR